MAEKHVSAAVLVREFGFTERHWIRRAAPAGSPALDSPSVPDHRGCLTCTPSGNGGTQQWSPCQNGEHLPPWQNVVGASRRMARNTALPQDAI